jgi:hypothetical protein
LRCRNLAATTADRRAGSILLNMTLEYDEQADRIEARAVKPTLPEASRLSER